MKYFFFGDHMYTRLRVERARDQVFCFDYDAYEDGKHPQDCIVVMPWIQTRKRMERAFYLRDAAVLLNRSPNTLRNYIRDGILEVRRGGRVWAHDYQEKRTIVLNKRMIMDFHDYLTEQHVGRPRKDGLITPKQLPPRPILEARMSEGGDYYIKASDGEYLPIWFEPDW